MPRSIHLLMLLLLTPAALADTTPVYNRVSLSAEASGEVANDLLVAVLYTQQEGNDAAKLAKTVNRDMQWAMDLAKRTAGIQAQTLNYRTAPIYRKNVASGWRVSQSMRLESTDTKTLSKLIGQLQSRLAVQSVSYKVSGPQRRRVEEQLITEALKRFQQRARLIADGLGHQRYRLVQLSVNGGGQPQPIYAKAAMMRAEADVAPRLEAGSSEVRVSVQGTVELSED